VSNLIIRLKNHEERRLRAGHLWVYSNEVDSAKSPLKNINAGALCRWEDARGKPLGAGYVNPNVLLCGRLMTRQIDAVFDVDWFARRFEVALALRQRFYPTPHYRVAYGEADGLPGLVVDRYGDVLVVQISTAGMEGLKEKIVSALEQVFQPRGILLRNDGGMRDLESLPRYVEEVGDVPDSVIIEESGVKFDVVMRGSQKTGWFFDQRDNRDRLGRYIRPESRVLDVFSYVGGWAVRASAYGAASSTCIDSSAAALEAATHNAQLNGQEVEALRGDALEVMKQLAVDGRRFDVVVVDPPALIKRKRDHAEGLALYGRLNKAALSLLTPNGILVSCSCSHHLTAEELQRELLRESRTSGGRLQILEALSQGPDHPIHPAIPETRYLKGFICTNVRE